MPAPRTAREMLDMARSFLGRKGLDEARLEAELLVAHALGMDRLRLFLELDRPVSGSEIDAARDALVRRGRREPVAYITGKREFYGRDFAVRPGVLIPRPETELIVDHAREWARARPADAGAPRVLDFGTGSGCLAVTLALEIEGALVSASDVSADALHVATENAQGLGAEVTWIEGDGLGPVLERGPFDLVVSNPPYVERGEASELAPEVREYEPEGALFAPEGDPDRWARELLDAARHLLAPDGLLLVELGHRQAPRALELARSRGLIACTHPDLAGIERVLAARGETHDALEAGRIRSGKAR
ncbi:MAG: peptide chain release factor N(5)-glutamine methyltransferase [bacterium]|nr:peptide chain release factor N(5)-glutamine methyltransferase [bacterium]